MALSFTKRLGVLAGLALLLQASVDLDRFTGFGNELITFNAPLYGASFTGEVRFLL